MPLGFQFQPDQEKRLRANLNRPGLSPSGNEALKILSLRLPNVLGGRPMAPEELLQPSVGGAGGSQSEVAQSVVQQSRQTDPLTAASGGQGDVGSSGPADISYGAPQASPASSPFQMAGSGSGGGGRSETSQLMALISDALHATPGKTTIHAGLDPNEPRNPEVQQPGNGTVAEPSGLDSLMRSIGGSMGGGRRGNFGL